MAESIFTRVQRVLSSGANATIDLAERLSGDALIRQARRELDEAVSDVRSKRDAVEGRREHAVRRQQSVHAQLATLDEQARFAVAKAREDLAQAAIARQLEHEAELKRLKKAESDAIEEIKRLDESLAALVKRRDQMKDEHVVFQGAKGGAANARSRPEARAERKADRAQEAFERAIASAGGIDTGPAPTGAADKLAEVETMIRDATVEERLASLRAAVESRPAAVKRAKARTRKG